MDISDSGINSAQCALGSKGADSSPETLSSGTLWQPAASLVNQTLPTRIAEAPEFMEEVVTNRLFSERKIEVLDLPAKAGPDDLSFFESFKQKYSYARQQNDLLSAVSLSKTLQEKFPTYFEKQPMRPLFKSDEQLNNVLAGISKKYDLDLLKARVDGTDKGFFSLVTVDNGYCLFDAIWQGLDAHKQYNLERQTGMKGYAALIAVLKDKSRSHEAFILKNSVDATGARQFESIDDYLEKLDEPEKFWAFHGVEGAILAEELGFNLVLKGGFDYMPELEEGFIEREDEFIYRSGNDDSTVYIGNRNMHYSAMGY